MGGAGGGAGGGRRSTAWRESTAVLLLVSLRKKKTRKSRNVRTSEIMERGGLLFVAAVLGALAATSALGSTDTGIPFGGHITVMQLLQDSS